jgi:hypothetical protein
MTQQWLRLHRQAVNNLKLQRHGLEVVGFWTNLLCLTDDTGALPFALRNAVTEIAWAMRLDEATTKRLFDIVIDAGLVAKTDDNRLVMHDWEQHQKRTDEPNYNADKQRRYRESKALRNAVTEVLPPRIEQNRIEQNRGEESEQARVTDPVELKPTDPEAPGWPKKPDLLIAVNYWNEVAGDIGLPKINGLAGERAKHLASRLKEIGSLGEWVSSVNSLKEQPFLTGKNDRNWRANFDWFVKPANFSKVIENTYERSRANGRA